MPRYHTKTSIQEDNLIIINLRTDYVLLEKNENIHVFQILSDWIRSIRSLTHNPR